MHTTQTVRERSRNIIRRHRVHDPVITQIDSGECGKAVDRPDAAKYVHELRVAVIVLAVSRVVL
jgi:hypothetical protein